LKGIELHHLIFLSKETICIPFADYTLAAFVCAELIQISICCQAGQGPLGCALGSADGVNLKWESMDDSGASAEEQVQYIKRVCTEHGVEKAEAITFY
jgi:hypothetical protein